MVGGQRARISLARACYSTADVYIMDDPLSAVDTHVGNTLFTEAVSKYLCNRTRILVTHQVQYLSHPAVSRVVVMASGAIRAVGTYDDLKANGSLDWVNSDRDTDTSNGNPSTIDETVVAPRTEGRGAESPHVDTLPQKRLITSYSALSGGNGNHGDDAEDVTAASIEERGLDRDDLSFSVAIEHVEVGVELTNVPPHRARTPSNASLRNRARTLSEDSATLVVEKAKSATEILGGDRDANGEAASGLIVSEDIEAGDVKLSTYVTYIKSFGGWVVLLILTLLMTLGQVHANVCICAYICVCLNVHIYMCVCMCIYIFLIIYIFIVFACVESFHLDQCLVGLLGKTVGRRPERCSELASVRRVGRCVHWSGPDTNCIIFQGTSRTSSMILAPLNARGLKVTLIAASNLHDSMLRSVLRAPILFFDR